MQLISTPFALCSVTRLTILRSLNLKPSCAKFDKVSLGNSIATNFPLPFLALWVVAEEFQFLVGFLVVRPFSIQRLSKLTS